MIGRRYRFLGRGSLRYLFRRGQTITDPDGGLRLRWVVNPRRSSPRLAVIVSKKVNKRAVVRNRIRRRLFEFWRPHLPNLGQPVDLALIVQRDDLAGWPAARLAELNWQLLSRLEQRLVQPRPRKP